MSESEWASSKFPHCPLPDRVVGQVNTQVWDARISVLLNEPKPNLGLINLMKEVSTQLKVGVDSHVSSPGTALTHCSNQLRDPDKVLPRVADALATFTAAGHIAGPLFNIDHKLYKINPIMATQKPGGHVRVVGDLSCPDTLSFNDGISEEWLKDWPVQMTTAPKFAKMLVHAGRNALMACSDLCNAYKMLPVCLPQRHLQSYTFCGALFIELKMVFGDKLACKFFDRFHFLILQAFVNPASSFPSIAQGRTVDDIPSCVPAAARSSLETFVKSYRQCLDSLNIRAADDDPTCTKAFDCSTSGEILGIRFDTESFTWSLPQEKLYNLVKGLRAIAAENSHHSLRELESIHGKLCYVSQLCPPLRTLTGDITFLLGDHIRSLSNPEGRVSNKQRDITAFVLPPEVRTDVLMLAAMMADTFSHPLPIMDPSPPTPLSATPIYPDASGHIANPTSPSLGIFFPAHGMLHSAAHSLPFPTDFLLSSNSGKLVADTTSTLEAMGILLPMMLEPHRCVGKALHFHIDNMAVVYSFQKRRSKDRLAHCLIRAAYLLAGAMASSLFVSWVPRRSDTPSKVADDLTHIDFASALGADPFGSTTSHDHFPPPIRVWMRNPHYDRDLGHTVIAWMSSHYDNLL